MFFKSLVSLFKMDFPPHYSFELTAFETIFRSFLLSFASALAVCSWDNVQALACKAPDDACLELMRINLLRQQNILIGFAICYG